MPRKKKEAPKVEPQTQEVTFKLKSTTYTLQVPLDAKVPKQTAPYRVWYNFWKRWQ